MIRYGWPRPDRITYLCAFALFFATSIFAQGRGSVSGHVADTGGGILQGARITLEPSAPLAKSDNQGNFTVSDLTPGNYRITVAYVGLTPFTTNVTVSAGQPARVDAILQVANMSESIVVTAERVHGEAEAINRQRTAENILQVLPSEVITSLPNANVADAIGRLPGVTLERDEGEGKYVQIRGTEPRYSNVTVDGVNLGSPESGVRQIKLDVIPSDLVESVEINKTLQANQDGDAIGGSVNLRTKEALDLPTISLFGLGGYTPILNGRGVSQFGGTIGRRFGREKKLGILFGGAYDWNGRGIDDLEPAPDVKLGVGTYPTEDLREYRYYRGRYGFAGTVDYRISDNSNVYVRGLYSHFDNFGDRWVYTPTINTFSTPFQGGLSPDTGLPDGNMSGNAQIRRPVEVIGSLSTGGRHSFGGSSWLTWEASAGRSASEDKGYSSTNFGPIDSASPLNNVLFGVDLSNRNRPKLPVLNGVNIYDPTQYFLTDFDRSTNYSPQVNLQAGASYGKAYSWGGHSGIFELGGKFRNAHKFNEANDRYYDINDPGSYPISNFLGSFKNSNYYDKSYTLGPLVDYSKLTSLYDSTPSAYTLNVDKTHLRNDPNNFNLLERVSAGYLMNSLDFGRFRLYTGVRFEGTTENVLGYIVTSSDGAYVSTNAQRRNSSYVDVLPSAQLRYSLTPESDIRFAYGRGIARPNFGDLVPYVNLDDRKNTIDIGNPDLKATHANNYDLLYEHYLKPLGLLQAGFFYKDITKPIYTVATDLTSGTYNGFTQTQPVNGSSAYVYGFEIAYQQRLAFLPGKLGGFGVSANYSYTSSEARGVPGRSDNPALQRQAPNTWNVSPTYDRGRLSFRVGLAYNGPNIFQYNYQDGNELGKKGPLGDTYLYSHFQVDAQGSVALNHGFSVYAYVLNANNEVFGFYNGSPIWPIQREYYKPTVAMGVRWSLSPEQR